MQTSARMRHYTCIPEYSAVCRLFHVPAEDIWGSKKEGYANVTKLMVSRYETDSAGKKRAYPWSVQIQNGIGIKGKNSNGGTYCKKG